jgi:hypothetical protein
MQVIKRLTAAETKAVSLHERTLCTDNTLRRRLNPPQPLNILGAHALLLFVPD